MTYLFGSLILGCLLFVGFIVIVARAVGKDADEYDAHTDFGGET